MDYQQAETTVLAGLVADRHLLTVALNEGFHPDQIANPVGRRLAKALVELYPTDGAHGVWSVWSYLEANGQASQEMHRYITSLASRRPPEAAEMMGTLELLRARESVDRLARVHEQLGTYLQRQHQTVSTGSGQPDVQSLVGIASDAIRQLLEVQRGQERRQVMPVVQTFGELAQHAATAEKGRLLGYSIHPFDRLNALLSGLRKGFYYGLAGAPRRGKTNFALELATYVASNHRIPVLFYSWEQTRRVLAARLLGRELGVNPTRILLGYDRGGSLEARVREAGASAGGRFGPYLFLVEAGRKDTLDRVRAHAYKLMQEFQTSDIVIFFDYLQKVPLGEHIENLQARTDMISTALAEMSLELNCPIFTISPLDKEGCRLDERPADEGQEFNIFNRPTMHHAMGSGDLEYDLDVAMVLAKDWKATADLYQIIESKVRAEEIDPAHVPSIDIINLFVDKNRDAPDAASFIVQYAFFTALNKHIELDYKLEKEYRPDFHGFTKTHDLYSYLREAGYIRARARAAPAPQAASPTPPPPPKAR